MLRQSRCKHLGPPPRPIHGFSKVHPTTGQFGVSHRYIQTLSHAQPLPTQVAGPSVATGVRSNAPPTVTGVPVGGYGNSAYNPGYAGGPNVVLIDAPPEGYVEVDEISPAGWCCLIAGCFFFPLNLLGLCMRERRLVPASHVYY